MGGAVAAFAAFALVGAGGDADPPAAGANANPDADRAAVAVVFAFQQRSVFSRDQVDIAAGRQRHVVARFQLAADRVQIAFAVGNAEVVLYLR